MRPDGPLSGYVNVALNHAYGCGPITGGFFPTAHADRATSTSTTTSGSPVNASARILARRFYVSATEIYGSGLTNGVDPATCGCATAPDSSTSIAASRCTPNYITNLSAGYTFLFGGTTVRPELFVDNLFDQRYLLKGAFFSGASVGRPRSIQFRVNLGI